MTVEEAVRGAIGPYPRYCDGYGNPGASGSGYIAAISLQIGVVESLFGNSGLDAIRAFDDAASSGTYTAQINFVQASSFCGTNGVIWGYDVVRPRALAVAKPLFSVPRPNGDPLPAYSAEPLLEAARALFGTRDSVRFRLIPGAHLPAATKGFVAPGPCYVWCAMSLGIARDREHGASLFLEDFGSLPPGHDPAAFGTTELRNLARCAVAVAVHEGVEYERIFVGYRYETVGANQLGASKPFAPYVVLARDAVPHGDPDLLVRTPLEDWELASRS